MYQPQHSGKIQLERGASGTVWTEPARVFGSRPWPDRPVKFVKYSLYIWCVNSFSVYVWKKLTGCTLWGGRENRLGSRFGNKLCNDTVITLKEAKHFKKFGPVRSWSWLLINCHTNGPTYAMRALRSNPEMVERLNEWNGWHHTSPCKKIKFLVTIH